ncbi:Uncharacterised protein [Mycobacteroides abscessus]|uniref:hypothetical protein n=1 Tax=Mycobacteroides abscessus TaxID=36809 RepID=UPI0005E9AFDA|nr:hypothetical protein [Mycobacteroides abscessus]CPX20677.1 Uncharacterised protein [Mycobacteroides abscessus]CRG61242.1 Uncharacterised protein [Mycobacteroides abscessus]
MTTTPDPTITVTPDEARIQADKLEAGAARAEGLLARITAARDASRDESAEYVGEYDPKPDFPDIQSPAQQSGVALMLHLTKQRDDYAARAAGLRQAIADLEAMDVENGDDIDAVDIPNMNAEQETIPA